MKYIKKPIVTVEKTIAKTNGNTTYFQCKYRKSCKCPWKAKRVLEEGVLVDFVGDEPHNELLKCRDSKGLAPAIKKVLQNSIEDLIRETPQVFT